MTNLNTCQPIATYRKADPAEIISPGDIIMIDPNTAYIKRAVAKDFTEYMVNSRLIVGVCIGSDNDGSLQTIINGGSSEEDKRVMFSGGLSKYEENAQGQKPEIIYVDGGSSEQNQRQIINVAYTGIQLVNICGYVNLGDLLCISCYEGKARSKDYLDNEFFYTRTIGKVIKYTNNPSQVMVLLDIE